MSSEDIRRSILLLESIQGNAIPVEEAAPMGFFKTLATGAAALFSDVALGKLDVGKAANKTYANYLRYLGSIGKNATGGTVGDLFTFLAKSGSNQKAMMAGLSKGTGLPIRSEADVKKYWDTVIKTKDKVTKSIMSYTQNAAKLPPNALEPSDFAKQAQQGAAIVDRIEKVKASSTRSGGKGTRKPWTNPTHEPEDFGLKSAGEGYYYEPEDDEQPTDDIELAIKASIGSNDAKKQTAAIDAALKALGA